jgi:PPP family 3-phenylpropionic acid transporter
VSMSLGGIFRRLKSKAQGADPRFLQYAALEWAYWFAAAASGYLTVFLQSKGWSAADVGIVNAINNAVAIVASPFWGAISDKMRSIRKVLLLCIAVGTVMWIIVPVTSTIMIGPMMLSSILIPIGCFFRNPAGSLTNAWVVQAANTHRLNFGAIRLWGSISYAVMAVALGFLLPYIGVESTFYIYGVANIPVFLLILLDKNDGTKAKSIKLKDMQIGKLFGNYFYVTFLIFFVALNMPSNISLSFLPYLMKEMGADSSQLGLIMGYKALLEVPVLIYLVRLRRRFSLPSLMMLGGLFYITESLLYSVSNGIISLIAISTLHGLGGGIIIGCGANYIYGLAPKDLKATAQTVSGSVTATAGILGNLMGGYLVDAIGIRRFYLVCAGIMVVALLFFAATFWIGKRWLHKTIPEAAQRGYMGG